MRFILFIQIFTFSSCTDQQETSKQSVKDTALKQYGVNTEPVLKDSSVKPPEQQKNLLEGEPVMHQAGVDPVKPNDYLYSIDLTDTNYIVRINKQKVTLTYEKASAFLKANEKKIKGNTLSIITSDKTSYQKVVDALDLMVINNIKKYKLVTKDTTP